MSTCEKENHAALGSKTNDISFIKKSKSFDCNSTTDSEISDEEDRKTAVSSKFSEETSETRKNSIVEIDSELGKAVNFQESILIDDSPDGGYGWVVVFGAFLAQASAIGTLSSIMQDYFHAHLFKDNPEATTQLSLVSTLALLMTSLGSPIINVFVARLGFRVFFLAGTILLLLSLELASISTQIWHLYFTQGILFGAGACCMYVTCYIVTPQWFTKRRSAAMGIVASGSGFGGLVLPFVMNTLNRSLVYAWTYRILSFITLFAGIFATIFVVERVPRTKTKTSILKTLRFDVLKDVNFLLFCIGSDIAFLGYYVPYFFIPTYATYYGLSDAQGSSLISIASSMNFIGRITAGFLGDKFGNLNTNIIFYTITAVSALCIWTFAFTYESMVAFMVVFGFFSGSFIALVSPISASILGPEKFSFGLSVILFLNFVPNFGPKISSAIEESVKHPPFLSYKIFVGVTNLLGAAFLLALKLRRNKNPFAKV